MKRVLLGAMLVTLFVSCGKSPEEKANALIEKEVKKTLYHPETYDPVETRIDSAFTPFDDPAFYEKTVQLYKLGMSVDEYESKMKRAKSSMSIWTGPYLSAFGRNEYQEAKGEYNENAKNKKDAEKKLEKLIEELKIIVDEERQFIGFKARHRYRANNNVGKTVFGEMEFLFEKDMNRIIAVYDMDNYEYKAVQTIYKLMLNEDAQKEVKGFDYSESLGE